MNVDFSTFRGLPHSVTSVRCMVVCRRCRLRTYDDRQDRAVPSQGTVVTLLKPQPFVMLKIN